MYEDIIDIINRKKSILYVNHSNINHSSYIMQLLLSRNTFSDIAIIDLQNEINFINRNLKLDYSVELYGYSEQEQMIEMLKIAKRTTTQQLFLYHYPKNIRYLESLEFYFDYVIKVFDRDDYIIKKRKPYLTGSKNLKIINITALL